MTEVMPGYAFIRSASLGHRRSISECVTQSPASADGVTHCGTCGPTLCNLDLTGQLLAYTISATFNPSITGVALMATAPRTPEGGGESFQILFDQEKDGRWIAEIPELPGVMVYAPSKADAE